MRSTDRRAPGLNDVWLDEPASDWASVLANCRRHLADADASQLIPRFEGAATHYAFAPPLLYSIGLACLRFGYPGLWHYCTRVALMMPHVSHQDLVFRAEAKIRLDDWSGWIDREARLFNPRERTLWDSTARMIQWRTKAWDGVEVIGDMSIVVIADGGFGDCLQMSRYVPRLAGQAGEVIFAVRPECLDLLRHNVSHIATVVDRDALHQHRCDRYAWLMSMPALLGWPPTPESLSAPAPVVEVGRAHDRRVGVCWAGQSNHPESLADPGRPLWVGDLEPLFLRDDVRWISLQVGRWVASARAYPCVRAPATPLQSFADTANVIAGLDCVITVDTAVAHLAGALGVPTLLLLPCDAEFRWGTSDTTLWYPSMQLIRQRRPNDWSSVVATIMKWLDVETSSVRPAVR